MLFAAGILAAAVLVSGLLQVSPARADFGFKDLDVGFLAADGSAASQAGSHPSSWSIQLAMNTKAGPGGGEAPEQDLKDLRIVFPRGLVATPALLPRCSQLEFSAEECPPESAVGTVAVTTDRPDDGDEAPIYNLVPQVGSPAELAFVALQLPVRLEVALNPDPPYDLVASLANVSQADAFFGAAITIDGVPGGTPLLTLPRSCNGPLETAFEADSWQQPGVWTAPAVAETPGLAGCDQLVFEPTLEAKPTTTAARTASGLDLTLDAPDDGLSAPTGNEHADLEAIDLAFPPGMTVNASMAAGLDSCDRADYAREALGRQPGVGCPEAAKVGTVAVATPVLDEPVQGAIYVAQPDDPATAAPGAENPFDSMLALYLVLEKPQRGILVKLAMRVDADPATGRLTASLDGMPQLPISRLELHLRDGPRSPLRTSADCGTHSIRYRLTPSSGALPLEGESRFVLDGGCGDPGFSPALTAGSGSTRAGAATSFQLGLTLPDGGENLAGLALALPAGIGADLGAVPVCPAAAAGHCPEDTRVGSVHVVAGTAAAPLRIPAAGAPPGEVSLAGPYEGAPFSLAIVVPAQAGPFDLGTVVQRAPVFVDRQTAQARIRLDGLPQLLKGVPIDYRAIRVVLDRPGFLRNSTSCETVEVAGSATSATGRQAAVHNRFQVGGCRSLPFHPRLSLRLSGPTHRGAHPRLRAVVRGRKGDANIDRVAATLPPTELLDIRGIGAVCGIAQFDAGACPADSIRGHLKVWTPLLKRPLAGPLFLRSGSGRLPRLAASLRGQVPLDLVAAVASRRGRLRVSFGEMPDFPLAKAVLTLQGGSNGLLVNSGGLCARRPKVATSFLGQNGKRHTLAPLVRTDC